MPHCPLASKTRLLIALLGFAALANPAASEAQASPDRIQHGPDEMIHGLSSSTSTIDELLSNPAARAIVDKHLPGFSSEPGLRGMGGMTLRFLQSIAGGHITDAHLSAIDKDLAAAREATRTLFLGRWRPASSTCDAQWFSFDADGELRTHPALNNRNFWRAHVGDLITIGESFFAPFQMVSRDHVVIRPAGRKELVLHRCPSERGGKGR